MSRVERIVCDLCEKEIVAGVSFSGEIRITGKMAISDSKNQQEVKDFCALCAEEYVRAMVDASKIWEEME
jgi:hypothetical protein